MKLKLTALLHLCILIAVAITFSACAQNARNLKGTWKMEGYGKIIDIRDSAVNLYDTTSFSCVPKEKLKLKDLGFLGQFKQIAQDTLMLSSGITTYRLIRIAGLPDHCKIKGNLNTDPLYNFDVFYHTFRENYAYFKTRNINWDSLYTHTRTKINKQTTPAELYGLLSEMTVRVGDGHTTIAKPEELKGTPSKTADAVVEVLPLKEIRDHVLYQNLKDPTIAGRNSEGKGLINWGVIKGDIGYIQINGMICYLDFNIPDSLTGDKYWEKYSNHVYKETDVQAKEAAKAGQIISRALNELRGTKGIILDLRFNDGGFDAVSLELLKHFVAAKTLVFNKQAWIGKGLTAKQEIFVEPAEVTYKKPVVLLTSNHTASAAETFTLGTMAFKNFIRIGHKTQGIFSDALPKQLPNGWEFTLSNEIFTSASGRNLENIGISPDINTGPEQLKNLLVKDAALEAAVFKLNKR